MARIFTFLLAVFLTTNFAFAQGAGRIEGRIVSERNEPLIGVSVGLEGTSIGTTTDEEGKYAIRAVAAGTYTLEARFLSYTTVKRQVTIKPGSTTTVYLLLKPTSSSLSEVVVTGNRHGEFLQPAGSTATKMEAPLKSVPQSVQIISRKALDQMQVIRVEDAMRNVSGVTMETGFGGRTDIFQIRGFRTSTESIFKNGFRNSVRTYRETANIQQVEVMKGPASVLYGVSDPGGMINVTTKKPTAYTFQDIQLTANSFGQIRPAIDLGGSLNKSKTFKYRFNTVYEKGDTYRDFVSTERVFAAPAFTYDFSDKSSLTLEAEYLDHQQASDRGIVSINGIPVDVPASRSFGEPDNKGIHQNRLVQYNFQHRFNDVFSLRHAANFNYSSESRTIVEQLRVLKNTATVTRRLQDQYNFERNFAMQNELYASFHTGRFLEHKAVAGVELSKSMFDIWYKRANYDTLDIYQPQFNSKPRPFDKLKLGDDYRDNTGLAGFYVQDFLSVNQRLKLLLGARYDIWNQEKVKNQTQVSTTQRNIAFNPRVGALYELFGPVAVYGNWSRGFQPEMGRTKEGDVFQPVISDLLEGGAKVGLLNDKINIKAAYFNITRKNVPVPDPEDLSFKIQVGEVQSEGVETDVTGEVFPGLNLIATYSYTDARITHDTKENLIGVPFRGVSRHSGSFWSTYELQQGALKGLGFGGGLTTFGGRPGDASNTFTLPGYTRFEATAFYASKRFHVAANLRNLTNIKYYEGSQSATGIMPGAPINVQGTVGVKF